MISNTNHSDHSWQETIRKAALSVVSIKYQRPFPSDTDRETCAEATGFIAHEKGLIATSRHVPDMTPFIGRIILHDSQECDVSVAYVDPVHDFAFLHFDPKKLKTSVKALQLRPDLVKEGLPIRVLGNDAGEKFTILPGVISRIDRNAPEYDGYTDFNTHYIQAAASGKAGSSGSPAIDESGCVVAMVGGARMIASTNYLLPLDRVQRALNCLREDQPIPRGTLQIRFRLTSLDDCRKSGLPQKTEDIVANSSRHMLVAQKVLPDGPAASTMKVGDILVKVNGKVVTSFTVLDSIWDSAVGKKITMTLIRSGEEFTVELDVQNLYDITPHRIVLLGDASLQDVSYQIAHRNSLSLKAPGVFVSGPKDQFEFAGTDQVAIQGIDHKPTPNIDAFIRIAKDIPNRKRVFVEYKHLGKAQSTGCVIIWPDNMRIVQRNDNNGDWNRTMDIKVMPALPPVSERANFTKLTSEYPEAADAVRSFVNVTCYRGKGLDSILPREMNWHGIVVNPTLGFVLVAKSLVPHRGCIVSLTFADSINIDAAIIFIHPLQNYTLLKYDPKLVDAPVKTLEFSHETIQKGDAIIFCGLNPNYQPFIEEISISDIISAQIPEPPAPTYTGMNFDAIVASSVEVRRSKCGLLLDRGGKVKAFCLSYLGDKEIDYNFGLAAPIVTPILDRIRNGDTPELRMLNVEFEATTMVNCRHMGVPDAFIRKVQDENRDRHQLFRVRRADPGIQGGLQGNDILLTLNGKTITEASELDITYSEEFIESTIIRNGREMQLTLRTAPAGDFETTRFVTLGGATLQSPHQAARLRARRIPSNVFVSTASQGSTAERYELEPRAFVTNINGTDTPDLSKVLEILATLHSNTWLSITQVSLNGEPKVIQMRYDTKYFKTTDLRLEGLEWREWPINSPGEDAGAIYSQR